MFHTSDCKNLNDVRNTSGCQKKEPMPPFSPYVRMDEDLTELACQKLGIQDFSAAPAAMIRRWRWAH